MSDKFINEPSISLSMNFNIYSYYSILRRNNSQQETATMVRFNFAKSSKRFIISEEAFKLLSETDNVRRFSDLCDEAHDARELYEIICQYGRKNTIAGKPIAEVIAGPIDFCQISTTTGNTLYIPTKFQTLKNAMLLGLQGAHIDIELSQDGTSSTIKAFSNVPSANKTSLRLK